MDLTVNFMSPPYQPIIILDQANIHLYRVYNYNNFIISLTERLHCLLLIIIFMNGVDGYVDKFFKGSRRVGFVLVSSRHVIFVQKCCVSSRAVDVGGKVRKRSH